MVRQLHFEMFDHVEILKKNQFVIHIDSNDQEITVLVFVEQTVISLTSCESEGLKYFL